ncbi:NUDIX domain-containing protein [Actinomyces viscosus]|uniref:8-oxo-dGTP diphosphatase n=1 Tax=Actinomyces viscosus TaxID=1656 RepID=A0A448PM94_ACTVI|nr:NUDIX domain-containing protein [Actinomyces viscosus]TFH52630.1 NUDIX domain-containing protein [Actinomyces viscosus]VEI16821.1 CTP pyrophosphohydrolase [Actinomyces viscosus]
MSGSDTAGPSRLVVAAAVLDRLEHPTTLLCAARSYPPEHAGQYELPGGKVEPAETPRQALARELDEEIGLRVRLGSELVAPGDLAVPAPPGGAPGDEAPAWPAMHGFRMRVWLAEPARLGDRGRAGADHQRLEWVSLDPPDRLRQLAWLEADLPIIDALVAALGR